MPNKTGEKINPELIDAWVTLYPAIRFQPSPQAPAAGREGLGAAVLTALGLRSLK